MIGSMMVLPCKNKEEMKRWFNNEPYVVNNVGMTLIVALA